MAFADKSFPDIDIAYEHLGERPMVSVLPIALDADFAAVEQLTQALLRLEPKHEFVLTAGVKCLWRIDRQNPDAFAADGNGVAVDDDDVRSG